MLNCEAFVLETHHLGATLLAIGMGHGVYQTDISSARTFWLKASVVQDCLPCQFSKLRLFRCLARIRQELVVAHVLRRVDVNSFVFRSFSIQAQPYVPQRSARFCRTRTGG